MTPPDSVSVMIPCSNERWLRLGGSLPMTGDEWDQMLNVLEAMRPGLVVNRHPLQEIEAQWALTGDES